MKQKLIDIYDVLINEYKVVFRDSAIVLLLVVVPLFYPLLYVFFYNNEVVHDVKIVVVDQSGSSLSREYLRKLATHDIDIVAHYSNLSEAQEALQRQQAYAIIYIPSTFSKDINRGEQASILVYADMSSMLFYKTILATATEVSLNMGSHIRVQEMGFGTQKEDESKMLPIDYEWVPFFNVSNGFASFLVPAILILVIQQTMLLGIGTITGTHNDKRRFDVASCSNTGRHIGDFCLTIGKALCYVSIYAITSVWIIRIVPYLFRLPQIGDPLTIILFLFPFLFAAAFFAMTVTYFCSQREFPMLLIVFTSIPFLFLSGISWPWSAVPEPLKAFAYLLPSTPAIHGFVKINTMGASLADAKAEYITLWVQAIFYCIAAKAMYHWWIRYYEHKYKKE